MTIGIAAYGPQAGLAVFRALRATEQVAGGAIGGFVSFAAISGEGSLHRYETQRGGTSTLFIDGELTGAEPPREVQEATVAALMSSGPDRPEPLAQFVVGSADIGLVTGHRLPNRPGRSGDPINLDVLQRLAERATPRQAVDAVLDANPGADAGVIAVNLAGQIYSRNSTRVSHRIDLGAAMLEQGDNRSGARAAVSVLHNAISPIAAVAELATAIAMETLAPTMQPQAWLTARSGTPVQLGETNSVWVDQQLVAQRVITTDAALLDGWQDGAAIYIGSEVQQAGRCIGTTITEPYVVLKDGVVCSLSGQDSVRIGFRTQRYGDPP